MRELTAIEIDAVSGAGWLQDGLASLGSKTGAAVWSLGSNLSIDLPILGTVNLATIAPGLGDPGRQLVAGRGHRRRHEQV